MKKLRRLDIYGNQIEDINEQFFKDLGLEFLEKLNII
jgi:hypothetical protein